MKRSLSKSIIAVLTIILFGCATVVPILTPAVVKAAAYDVGYYGWAFTSLAPVSQLAINVACSLVPQASSNPANVVSILIGTTQQPGVLQLDWTAAYNILINPTYGPLIVGAAQSFINDINTLVGDINSTGTTSVTVQYVLAVVEGICQGIEAAQGTTNTELRNRMKQHIHMKLGQSCVSVIPTRKEDTPCHC